MLRLAADGLLGLDDPANRYLRAVRLEDDAVTVGELLSHSGGVDNPQEYSADSVPDLAALMGPVIPCDGRRGTVRASNGGYGVLGQLIADVTGLPFAHAAEELVLDPLGMRDSQFPAKAADIAPNAVTGYTLTPDGAFERRDAAQPRPRPADPGRAREPGGHRRGRRRRPAPRVADGRRDMIEVERLSKRFGPVTAVDDLSFTVRPGRVTGFLGPNGAGKTTTMRIVLGLAAPTSGRALVGGAATTG